MGTSACWGVRVDGQDKLSYCHYEGYPSGLGVDLALGVHLAEQIVAQRGEPDGLEAWKDQARSLRLVNQDDQPSEADKLHMQHHGCVDLQVGERSLDDWYCLTRHLQGQLQRTLEVGVMLDEHEFINDGLCCEWAYVVNLDKGVLEVYMGLQSEPHEKGRYASPEPVKTGFGGGYYPAALVGEWDLATVEVQDLLDLEEQLAT